MSMMPPPLAAEPSDGGIPAADPGRGAPEPAPGFGIGGEEPDATPEDRPEDRPEDAERADPPEGTAFRTPDPGEVGPGTPG